MKKLLQKAYIPREPICSYVDIKEGIAKKSPMSGKTKTIREMMMVARMYLRVRSADLYTASIFLDSSSSFWRSSVSSIETLYPRKTERPLASLLLRVHEPIFVPNEPENEKIENGEEKEQYGVRLQVLDDLVNDENSEDPERGGIRPHFVLKQSPYKKHFHHAMTEEIQCTE